MRYSELPDPMRSAIRSLGRSTLESVLNEADPPTRIVVAAGIRREQQIVGQA